MNFLGNLLVWNIASIDGPYLQRVYKKIEALEFFTNTNKTHMFALVYAKPSSNWVKKYLHIIVFNNDSTINPCKIAFTKSDTLIVFDISDA